MEYPDYIVIIGYLVVVFALGPIYRHFSSTASDYFRGGGTMLWWMAGCSSFLTTFTAWSFTGAAGQAYEAGIYVLLLFGANAIALIFTIFVTAPMFRQIRVITPVEAIRKRFGKSSEQFFTWALIPFYIFGSGIALYAVGLFMSVVFDVDVFLVIVALGIIVTLISVMGGAWAVVASDFLQFMIIALVVVVMGILVLTHVDIGGLSGLLENLPDEHFRTTELVRPEILILFAITLIFNQLIQMNDLWMGAGRYLYVKNGWDARRAAMVALGGFIVFPVLWLIPAMAARILHPDLAAQYPELNNPDEAAYVATAMILLPTGMLGLLVAAMFAATMSSMDHALNRSAGVFVRNVYRSLFNEEASEAHQIRLGRIITGILGIILIVLALSVSQMQQIGLFHLVLTFAALVGVPTTVPLFLGLFIKGVPPWAGWSTALVGITIGGSFRFGIPESAVQSALGYTEVLSRLETNSLTVGLLTALNLTVCVSWFLMTKLFARRVSPDYWKDVNRFFEDARRPIDMEAEGVTSGSNDRYHYHVLGVLSIGYGVFIMLMGALPNPFWGRMAFVLGGGSIAAVGAIFYYIAKCHSRKEKGSESTGGKSS